MLGSRRPTGRESLSGGQAMRVLVTEEHVAVNRYDVMVLDRDAGGGRGWVSHGSFVP